MKSAFQSKVLSEAAVGELVVIPNTGVSDLGIVITQNPEYDQTLVACFMGEQGLEPYIDRFNNEDLCLAYGSDWMLEIEPNASFTSDSALAERAGTLEIGASGLKLVVAANKTDTRLRGGHLNLATLRISSYESNCLFTRSWRIWASEDHRNTHGAVPLLDHS